jgi:hypothetical protein
MARSMGMPVPKMGGMGGISTPSYLPPMSGNEAGAPQKGFPSPVGKSLRLQNLGNILGMRGAGSTKMGGSQLAHGFNHYGKNAGFPGLEGGTEPTATTAGGSGSGGGDMGGM